MIKGATVQVITANNQYYSAQYPIDALAALDGLDTINTQDAETLDEAFRERVRRSSDKIAYAQFSDSANEWQCFSWADVATKVECWQVAFRQSGLVKGDRVKEVARKFGYRKE